jgi:hypothetical protein
LAIFLITLFTLSGSHPPKDPIIICVYWSLYGESLSMHPECVSFHTFNNLIFFFSIFLTAPRIFVLVFTSLFLFFCLVFYKFILFRFCFSFYKSILFRFCFIFYKSILFIFCFSFYKSILFRFCFIFYKSILFRFCFIFYKSILFRFCFIFYKFKFILYWFLSYLSSLMYN